MTIAPLACALVSSASTRAFARRAASSPDAPSFALARSLATASRSSSVKVSDRVISLMCASCDLAADERPMAQDIAEAIAELIAHF